MRIRYDAEFLHNVRSCQLYLLCTLDIALFTLYRVNIYSKQGRKTDKKISSFIDTERQVSASPERVTMDGEAFFDPQHPPGGRNAGPSVTG